MKEKIIAILILALLAFSAVLLAPGVQATGSGQTENMTFAEATAQTTDIMVSAYAYGVSQGFTVPAPVEVSWVSVCMYSLSTTDVSIGTTVGNNNIWNSGSVNANFGAARWFNLTISPAVSLNPDTTYYLSDQQYPGQDSIGVINSGSWLTERNVLGRAWIIGGSGGGPLETNSSYMAFTIGGSVPVYTVSFETSNTVEQWSVDLAGINQTSSSSSITFSVPNGTYEFQIPTVTSNGITYVASPSSGNVVVSGVNRIVSLSFIGQVYSVTFNESGLPSGTEWWVNITNGPSMHTNTSAISFKEPNGFVYFTTAAKGYSANPSSGTLPISGKNVSISVSFEKMTNGTGTIIYNNNTVKNYVSQNWPLFVLMSLIFLLAGWALTYFINPENRGKAKK